MFHFGLFSRIGERFSLNNMLQTITWNGSKVQRNMNTFCVLWCSIKGEKTSNLVIYDGSGNS